MKRFYLIYGLFIFSAVPGFSDGVPAIDEFRRDAEKADHAEAKLTKLDPKRIINDSNSFLKEREPEMTAEEYALYEKVVTIMTTKPEFALKLLEAMMNDKEVPSPAFEFILGNAYYAANQSDKAEEHYLNTVKRYPTFLRAWNNLGILYYAGQNYAEASRCFSKSIVLGDRDPQTFGLLAYSLEQQQKTVPAEMAYMQALAGDPSNVEWLEGLLRIYVQGKQFGRAEWLVKDLIRQKPADGKFWLTYANILISQNRKLEAIALLEICANTGVAGSEELNVLADLYAEQRLVPEAIAVYNKIRVTSPDLGERRMLNFAQLLTYEDNFARAQEVLDALREKISPGVQTGYLLAQAELDVAQKKWDAARQHYQTALKIEPMNGTALLGLGRTYSADNDWAHALLIFEEAYQIPSSTYRASLELATIEVKNRHYEKTVQYLEKALSIEKTDAVQDFLARIRPMAGKQN